MWRITLRYLIVGAWGGISGGAGLGVEGVGSESQRFTASKSKKCTPIFYKNPRKNHINRFDARDS